MIRFKLVLSSFSKTYSVNFRSTLWVENDTECREL